MPDLCDELLLHVAQVDKHYGKGLAYFKVAAKYNMDQYVFNPPESSSTTGNLFRSRITNIFDQMDHDLELCKEYINIRIKHQIEEEKSKFI